MYGLLRRWQLGAGAALFGALSFVLFVPFAMRASAQANILAGLALMPWAVLAATVHFERGRQRWAMLTGALVGLQVLAGHVQPAVHTAMLIGLIAFLRRDSDGSAKPALRTLASGTWMALAASVVALPQILITSGYLAEAYRWIGGADPLAPGKQVPWRIFGFEHILEPKSLLSAIDPWRFGASDGNALPPSRHLLVPTISSIWSPRCSIARMTPMLGEAAHATAAQHQDGAGSSRTRLGLRSPSARRWLVAGLLYLVRHRRRPRAGTRPRVRGSRVLRSRVH